MACTYIKNRDFVEMAIIYKITQNTENKTKFMKTSFALKIH